MKKHMIKAIAFLLCVSLLTVSLCGCSQLLETFGVTVPDLPFLQQKEVSNEFVLSGPTDFYAEPSWDSPLLATYYEGYTVTYGTMVTLDGVTWAQADEGWFAIDGNKPAEILQVYTVQKDCAVTELVTTYTEPGTSASAIGQLNAGTLVPIQEIALTTDGEWGHMDNGWVSMEHLYTIGDIGQYHGFGVIREDEVSFFSAPGVQSNILANADSGARFEILEQICIDGYWWGYTESGWVSMDAVYVEGTTGTRPCTATVIDPTPLNVRLAPGTDNEVLTTLTYGDQVTILEQVDRDGEDWGFTGTGWVFMGLVEIH